MRGLVAAVLSSMAVLLAVPALAHPLSPVLLELRETAAGTVEVTWRKSVLKLPGSENLRPVLPQNCKANSPERVTEDDEGITTTWTLDCGHDGLAGARVGVRGLAQSYSDALIRVVFADGTTVRGVVSDRTPFFTIAAPETASALAARYLGLGARHVLGRVDALFFILGLVLLVRSRRLLLAAITSFAIGQSLTLTLVVLAGLASAAAVPVEGMIALCLYVLAVELARERGASSTLMQKHICAMALGVGLLFGTGFAGALGEIGLPPAESPLALLSFNVGIGVGQLALVLAMIALAAPLRRSLARLPAWTKRVPAYAMGSLAMLWMIERSRLF